MQERGFSGCGGDYIRQDSDDLSFSESVPSQREREVKTLQHISREIACAEGKQRRRGTRSSVVSLFGVKIDHKQRVRAPEGTSQPATPCYSAEGLCTESEFLSSVVCAKVSHLSPSLFIFWLRDKSRPTFSNG